MDGTAVQGDLDDDIPEGTSCLSPQGCKRCRAAIVSPAASLSRAGRSI
jgi:hypothetical protein